MNKRWYDADATVGLAVSLLRNSDELTRKNCASFIIKEAQDKGVVIKNNLLSAFDYALRRWYDEEETIFEAMEYLRISPVEVQKELAFDIIEYLEVSAV
ncbi:hypothetical protein IJE86_01075 [bacterium]|nr:hypothetical protein [bacterium]